MTRQLNIYNAFQERTTKTTGYNRGLAKVAVQWLNEHLCFVSSSVVADSFVLRNRHLRQAPNRYATFKEDSCE